MRRVDIGIDIGGTFTDGIALLDDARFVQAKTLSTHDTNPADGVLRTVEILAAEAGMTTEGLLGATVRFSHGTTIGTNLVVERKGARVALVTTVGHRDSLLIMRGAGRVAGLPMDRVFDVQNTSKPTPLVPSERILEVHERVDRHGCVLVALDPTAVTAVLKELLEREQVDALAISLLWSFKNPGHEQMIADIAREIDPELFISMSSEVSPRLGEFERTVATVLNGYIGPASRRYLLSCAEQLQTAGLGHEFLVMQSHGGVVPVSVAVDVPFATLDSGPTGGLVATAALAAMAGHPHVVATDMGGTSFDVGLVVDGEPIVAEERVIDQYTYRLPALDVRSIACGGGTIAWVDRNSGSLRVGPHSAGSAPGPACYGRGGAHPTVTDADVVLGFLDPDRFLDGEMRLDASAARDAVDPLATELGLTIEETAAGILRVNNNNASILIHQRTVEQGLDPRDFVVYAFGGAAAVHAWGYAADLGVRQVVVPLGNGASALSAYGIASTDVIRYFDTECLIASPFDADELAAVLHELELSALKAFEAMGYPELSVEVQRFALMRYAEQDMQSLPIRLPGDEPGAWAATLAGRFTEAYARLYGAGAAALFHAVEIFALRVRASVSSHLPDNRSSDRGQPVELTTRPVFWPDHMAWIDTTMWDGATVRHGAIVEGPALVQLPHTSVAVPTGHHLTADVRGNLVLHMEPR